MQLNVNSLLIIACTIFLALVIVIVHLINMYRNERQRREEKAEENFLNKIGNILTDREKEILRAVEQGKTSKEIADAKFISEDTVKTHRKNINRKLKENKIVKRITIEME